MDHIFSALSTLKCTLPRIEEFTLMEKKVLLLAAMSLGICLAVGAIWLFHSIKKLKTPILYPFLFCVFFASTVFLGIGLFLPEDHLYYDELGHIAAAGLLYISTIYLFYVFYMVSEWAFTILERRTSPDKTPQRSLARGLIQIAVSTLLTMGALTVISIVFDTDYSRKTLVELPLSLGAIALFGLGLVVDRCSKKAAGGAEGNVSRRIPLLSCTAAEVGDRLTGRSSGLPKRAAGYLNRYGEFSIKETEEDEQKERAFIGYFDFDLKDVLYRGKAIWDQFPGHPGKSFRFALLLLEDHHHVIIGNRSIRLIQKYRKKHRIGIPEGEYIIKTLDAACKQVNIENPSYLRYRRLEYLLAGAEAKARALREADGETRGRELPEVRRALQKLMRGIKAAAEELRVNTSTYEIELILEEDLLVEDTEKETVG